MNNLPSLIKNKNNNYFNSTVTLVSRSIFYFSLFVIKFYDFRDNKLGCLQMPDNSGDDHDSIASSSDNKEDFVIDDDNDLRVLMHPLPPERVPKDRNDDNVDIWASAIRIIESNPAEK